MAPLRSAKFHVLGGLLLTALFLWYAIAGYLSSVPVAESILRGMSLSLGQAIESVAASDQFLKAMSEFSSRDIAYFSIIDQAGRIRFHSNPDLIGETVADTRYQEVIQRQVVTEERIRLGTGEVVFETHQQLHLSGSVLVLRLALHTWQADQIILRARTGVFVICLLLAAAWGMGLLSLKLQRRDLQMSAELARHEHLARLGELGAVMAHEVRTPLAGIKGFAQLLGERVEEPRNRQYADMIVKESERLEALVDDLLIYARQDVLLEGTASIDASIKTAWESLSAKAEHVELQINGRVEYAAACSPDHLYQVLLNLFSNAIQAMPGGGKLEVTVSRVGDLASLVIADSGPGFTDESLKRAFDPFYTTRASGSGLGLAVCRKIVEAYGGTITVANGCKGGGVVTVRMPLSKELS